MVLIKDEGSQFDAPIDKVWKYIQAPDHGPAHPDNRNVQIKPLSETSVLISFEQKNAGNWSNVVNRITVAPPLGVLIEVLEGPMAGSKIMNVYTPRGNRTGIDVYGSFDSKVIPPNQLESSVRAFLEKVFKEDSAALKTFPST